MSAGTRKDSVLSSLSGDVGKGLCSDEGPGYLSVAQVSARLQVSDDTVYRACKSGSLRYCMVGRQIRITPAQIEAWVNPDQQQPGKGKQSLTRFSGGAGPNWNASSCKPRKERSRKAVG